MMNRGRQRGITLVEALVAMAIMAFGILGVVGVQSTLRFNADVSKQRAEAVRIAQAQIETWRGFTVLVMPVPPGGHTTALANLVSGTTTITGTSNTDFTVTNTVTPIGTSVARAVEVQVSWTDRIGNPQSVVLGTQIAGVLPEVSGSLSVAPKSLTNAQARGRNPVIPTGAIDVGGGSSTYLPPGSSTVTWVFNNISGLITSICNPYPGTCTATNAALLSGFVTYAATGIPVGTPWSAEIPLDPLPTGLAQVLVNTTVPTTSVVTCYQQAFTGFIAYYCAIPLSATTTPNWSGRAVLDNTSLAFATSMTETSASKFRVCRFTPDPSTDTPQTTGPVPVLDNAAHPLDYAGVSTSLSNQNFLVIPAGTGSAAYACPIDDSSTPFIDGDTRAHQPN